MRIISDELAEFLRRVEIGLCKDLIRLEIMFIENKLNNLYFWCLMCKLDLYTQRLDELQVKLDELR